MQHQDSRSSRRSRIHALDGANILVLCACAGAATLAIAAGSADLALPVQPSPLKQTQGVAGGLVELPAPARAPGPRLVAMQFAPSEAPASPSSSGFVLADRRLVQRIKKAKELIEEKRYADAIPYLQQLLESDEDSFFHPDADAKTRFRSLKAEAKSLIGELPDEGKEAYRLNYGATADALLDDALKTGDARELGEVARRYFHTKSGYEAAYRLGVRHFDGSRPLAAALAFEQLRKIPEAAGRWEPTLTLRTAACWHRAGMPERAAEVVGEMRSNHNVETVQIAGRGERLAPNPAQDGRWLTRVFGTPQTANAPGSNEWAVYRGRPSRNAGAGEIASNDQEAWTVSTVLDPRGEPGDFALDESSERLRDVVKSLSRRRKESGGRELPAAHPLFIRGRLVVRTLGRVEAFDPTTGGHLWSTMCDAPIDVLIDSTAGATASQTLNREIDRRLWKDATFGRLAGDGRRVYAVEVDEADAPSSANQNGRPSTASNGANSLFAYDLETGKVLWYVGGPAELKLPHAGTFFLGPPLPLGGRLYCIAETAAAAAGRVVRLLALDPRDGSLEWSQTLADLTTVSRNDPTRRLSGSTPAYADGVLVCPTGVGGVVALELTSRSLLWGYRFRDDSPPVPRRRRGRQLPQPGPTTSGWLDSIPTIVGGKVLLTPRHIDELHCVGLLDGRMHWKKPRGTDLYVAGVHDDRAIIVAFDSVHARKIEDGAPAFKKPTTIEPPAGRGIIAGSKMILPVRSGKLIAVDVESGEKSVVAVNAAAATPGNLISAGGALVSQTTEEVGVIPFPATP